MNVWYSLLVGTCALTGCSGSGKREAAALTDAVDRFRSASDAALDMRAAAVGAVSCSEPRVCDAKKSCADAVRPTARAFALKDEVSKKIADIYAARLAPDSAEAQSLPLKLDEATQLLREGREKMDECDTKLTDLRTMYRF